MSKIQFADVRKRLQCLSRLNSASSKGNTFSEGARLIINTNRATDIKRFIESAGRGNQEVSFEVIMELFDALIECGSVSDINKMGQYIIEYVQPKTRDAKRTESLIRRRLTRLQNKLKPPSTVVSKIQNIDDKDKAIKHVYESMIEKAIIYQNCDRMLENYNRISRRFNLEAVINENTKANGVKDTVIELCNRIDTYSMPNAVKFNTVIETALYGFESNSISYKKSDILETAIDYFAFKEDGLKSCKEILEATLFYDKNDDMSNIDILTEDEPEENDSDTSSVDAMIRSRIVKGPEAPIITTESTEFSEIFEKFKKEELAKEGSKPESKLRQLVTKLYARNVDSIVEQTPNLLTWIRSFFIIGSCAVPIIGPVLMIIGFIADRFISLHMDKKEVKKMIDCFDKEIKTSQKKLSTITNNEDKSRLEEYIKSLENAREKIYIYYNDLLSDLDIESEYDSIDLPDNTGDDFDDFDFDNFDISINEIANTINSFIEDGNIVDDALMYNLPSKISNDDICNISNMVAKFPEIFYKDSFKEGVENELAYIRKHRDSMSIIDRSVRITAMESALNILENTDPEEFNKSLTIFKAANQFNAIYETYSAINMIETASVELVNRSFLEASFINTLKLASMKLRNALQKMKDKDRQVSKSIDVSMNNISKSAERALTTDNRESIIKGSILPSASKIIKLALANAGLIALQQPVAAVIMTLGYLGCSAKFKTKERQMLIDEIEIELKMCDKYIDIAEQKNDMKALKQLLMTKRDLERQLQRIKYKMRVDLGKKYYDPKHVGDE